MAQAAVPLLVISSVLSAKSAIDEGKARKNENKARAAQEKLAARDRSIARNEELLDELARRRVAQASGGGGAGGSFAAGQRESFRQARLGQASDDASTAGRVRGLRVSGKNAVRQSRFRAGASLLRGIGQAI